MAALVLLFIGLCAFFLGRTLLRAITFPLGFLVCMAPLPVAVSDALETFLQHRSAAAAAGFFKLYGTPFFRVETYFQLPGFSLNVAPECSGIHSSLALFITSLLAAWLFLRSPWKRAILCLAVLPLAVLRNGLRVFVIGELCVHVGPEMIDSYIHRHGGPVFFVLSLVPFFLLLLLLLKTERRRQKPGAAKPLTSA
jgi:exosortase C (VPDSG-CTERM-specific)